MAHVENGVITLTEEEAKEARKTFCLDCDLNIDCGGPDSKTNKAEIHSSIDDAQIVSEAACSPKIKVKVKV